MTMRVLGVPVEVASEAALQQLAEEWARVLSQS